jgi:prepilin-type N-terminal cleavage/methylation domain-containing protein
MPMQTAKRKISKVHMVNTCERNAIHLGNQSGFTLLEMMCILVIVGMIFSITIHRFNILSDTAYQKALQTGIQELNIRETLTWYDFKISIDGWANDDEIFSRLDTHLGGKYRWDPSAEKLGGSLHFGSYSVNLVRTPSTNNKAGSWH